MLFNMFFKDSLKDVFQVLVPKLQKVLYGDFRSKSNTVKYNQTVSTGITMVA